MRRRLKLLCFQLQQSARRLPDDESGVATRSTSLDGLLGNEAASLYPDNPVAVVLQGGPGELGGVRTAGESDRYVTFKLKD